MVHRDRLDQRRVLRPPVHDLLVGAPGGAAVDGRHERAQRDWGVLGHGRRGRRGVGRRVARVDEVGGEIVRGRTTGGADGDLHAVARPGPHEVGPAPPDRPSRGGRCARRRRGLPAGAGGDAHGVAVGLAGADGPPRAPGAARGVVAHGDADRAHVAGLAPGDADSAEGGGGGAGDGERPAAGGPVVAVGQRYVLEHPALGAHPARGPVEVAERELGDAGRHALAARRPGRRVGPLDRRGEALRGGRRLGRAGRGAAADRARGEEGERAAGEGDQPAAPVSSRCPDTHLACPISLEIR